MFVLPAEIHEAPARSSAIPGRTAPGTQGVPSAAADGARRMPVIGRHVAQPVPSPAATAASAESRAAVTRAGNLPSSQTWALLGGVLLAVCMIARRQRQQA